MHALESILGTKTKIRILDIVTTFGGPMKRNRIVKERGGSMHGTYEQIEELIGAGVLKEEDSRISYNDSFPFLDDLKNLILSSSGYLRQLQDVLRRLDILFKDRYYVGGFLAGRKNIVPLDYDTSTVLFCVLEFTKRDELRIKGLDGASAYELIGQPLEQMPKDIARDQVFGVEVWIASAERGIVESFTQKDCTSYAAYLILLQNLMDSDLDLKRLKNVASAYGQWETIAAAIYRFSERTSVSIPSDIVQLGREHRSLAEAKEIDMAMNTVLG